MKKSTALILSGIALVLASCSVTQSVVKSTFPYTATLLIPRSSAPNVELPVSGAASSFDEGLQTNGTGADRISDVKIVSAKIKSKDPGDFNIGNFDLIKVYMSKAGSAGEVLVASRKDITPDVGNSMVLDIDNSNLPDSLVHDPDLTIKMVYRLRNHIDVNAQVKLVLGISASPKKP
jgi:hypothetical protein